MVKALLWAAGDPESEGQLFNPGHWERISIDELAALLVQLNKYGRYRLIPSSADQKAIDIGDYYGDFSKTQNVLGWSPSVLENGLALLLAYYRKHHAHYRNSKICF